MYFARNLAPHARRRDVSIPHMLMSREVGRGWVIPGEIQGESTGPEAICASGPEQHLPQGVQDRLVHERRDRARLDQLDRRRDVDVEIAVAVEERDVLAHEPERLLRARAALLNPTELERLAAGE